MSCVNPLYAQEKGLKIKNIKIESDDNREYKNVAKELKNIQPKSKTSMKFVYFTVYAYKELQKRLN